MSPAIDFVLFGGVIDSGDDDGVESNLPDTVQCCQETRETKMEFTKII